VYFETGVETGGAVALLLRTLDARDEALAYLRTLVYNWRGDDREWVKNVLAALSRADS
jgi:hypothetical protein